MMIMIPDVQFKVDSVGICGTDIHFWAHGAMGPFKLTAPHIMGHESSGIVTKVGSKVTNLKVGDRITMEPAIPCFSCEACRRGENNLCPSADVQVVGSPPKNGCFQRYFVHPAELCHKLPESMTLEEGALVEPMACVVHAVQRAGITAGQNVLVCGSGPMGLLCLLTAKAFGVRKVCITDINPLRLKQGKEVGSDCAYLIDPKKSLEEQTREIAACMDGGPHVTLECTGVESSLRLSLNVTRRGGKVALVGLGPELVNVPLCMSSLRQVDIIGCARYNNTFPLAIDLIASKRVDAARLVTHKFKLEEASQAFETVISGEGNKVLIKC